jgi:anti-sigma factor ChrR (cupin superfamily)
MPQPTDGLAAEYVLGLLDAVERDALERRMADAPAARDAVSAWTRRLMPLHASTPPEAPPPALWAAIQARTGAAEAASVRRQTEGVWLSVARGVSMRMLHVDPVAGTRSAVMRMQPDSVVPAHEHDMLEECYVIDGSIRIGSSEYSAGDHVLGPYGTIHHAIMSASGATLLLHWSPTAA